MRGRVVLVGAGPGDPDLLTVRALREIRGAEVLLYDALIPSAIVDLASKSCLRIDVGKRAGGGRGVAQTEIGSLLLCYARAGRYVVRLKGGDPFLFGRGGEEASVLSAAGVPFEVVPGVSSLLAAPAYAGIPLTDRRLSSSIAVITGHRGRATRDERIDWEGLARSAETLVVMMGTRWLDDIARRVIAGGRDPMTPAAVIQEGTTPRQRVVVAPLSELAERVREAGLRAPTTIVIGEVVRLGRSLGWYERRPLFGRRVLVTRALDQGAELVVALLARGAEPVRVPLLEFAAPRDPLPLESALEQRETFDWIVFASANAVRATADRLRGAPARVACIGPATTRVARAAGLAPAFEPPSRALPGELVERLRAVCSLAGARVLLPRADRAREELALALSAAGARVTAVEAYRSVRPEGAGPALEAALQAGVDAVLLASPSAVRAFLELGGAPSKRLVLACIGPTTALALRERGIEPQVVAERQTSEDWVSALESHFAKETHVVP